MKKFLEQLAEKVLVEYPDSWQNHLFVFPGRRAGLFFTMHMAKGLQKAAWAPQTCSMDEFMAEVHGQETIGSLELLFEGYRVYQKLEDAEEETFEKFLFWAPKALADFNEVDNYMLEPERLFKDLRDFKEIEEWSFGAADLSNSQEEYASFWETLGRFYHAFRDHLSAEGLVTTGIQKRILAESTAEWAQKLPYEKVWFAGFSALSTAEQKILLDLESEGRAHLVWDTDSYYLEDENNEAGLFFCGMSNFEDIKKSSPSNLAEAPKNIETVSAATPVSMVKAAMTKLSQLDASEMKDTAIVLADEKLLEVVLASLPQSVSAVNVTMGYPIVKLPLVSLVKRVMSFWQNDLSKPLYHKDFFGIVQMPVVVEVIAGMQTWQTNFEKEVQDNNLAFFNRKDIPKASDYEAQRFLDVVFNSPPKSAAEAIESVYALLALFHNQEAKAEGLNLENSVFKLAEVMKVMREYQEKYAAITSVGGFKKVFEKLVSRETLDFYGEPLEGLQIMGLLESRALDFKRVILLGVNEEVLPKVRRDTSFIPFEIKQLFGLPSFRHRDAIFAYYFYRLAQRTSELELYFHTNSDVLGGGEKSRYLMQLEYELPKRNAAASFYHQTALFPSGTTKRPKVVPKLPELLARTKKLLESGVSPSAINKYLGCSLDFYYRYLIGLKEPNLVEEDMEVNTLGTIAHEALEQLYKPLEGKKEPVSEAFLTKAEALLQGEVEEQMLKNFSDQTKIGPNFIKRKGIEVYVQKMLQLDKQVVADKRMYIEKLEERLEGKIELEVGGEKIVAKLRGSADRIDQLAGQTRVVDYKTGKVEPRDLILKTGEIEKILQGKKSKALQVLIYAYAYLKKEGNEDKSVTAGIISLRNISAGFIPLVIDGETGLTKAIFPIMKEIMEAIVTEMLGEAQYVHAEDAKFCNYCEV